MARKDYDHLRPIKKNPAFRKLLETLCRPVYSVGFTTKPDGTAVIQVGTGINPDNANPPLPPELEFNGQLVPMVYYWTSEPSRST